jgi:hypothetical protein
MSTSPAPRLVKSHVHCFVRGAVVALVVLLAPLRLTAQVPAQPVAPDPLARVRYEASFFVQFSPQTALDIVNETPGFALIDADGSETRGFAGAVGNVLIDGERPSAKSQTLTDILQRIPAAQVAYVEIRRGADVAADASGQAVLLNVVLMHVHGHGAWSTGFEYAGQHQPAPNGTLSWDATHGTTEYSIGASTYSLKRELPDMRQELDGQGTLLERRAGESPREFAEYAINGAFARPFAGGRLHLTGQAYHSRYHEDAALVRTTPDGRPAGEEQTPYTERTTTVEGGATLTRAVLGWQTTTLGLVTRKRDGSDTRDSQRAPVDDAETVFAQTLARDGLEAIARATASRQVGAHRVEAGLEGAVNTLDAAMTLVGGPPDALVPIDVPNANVRVREHRVNAFLSHVWTIDSDWSTDAQLAVETSRLAVAGDARRAVTLTYWKPRVEVTRTIDDRDTLQFRLFRDVGQLDFTDFASAASLADRQLNGGNPDLRPQTSWRGEVGVDVRAGAGVAVSATVFHAWLRDVVDLVPWGAPGMQIDAPGNIDRGRVAGVTMTARSPLTRVLPGGSISLTTTLQHSVVRDPVTGRKRPISSFQSAVAKVELRDDLPAVHLSWGVTSSTGSATSAFRLQEIDRHRASPSLDVFVEHPIHRLKIRLSALSILGSPEDRERTFSLPDRTAPVSQVERVQRWPGHWWLLTVSRTF